MNRLINKEIDKIFSLFNKKFFDSSLPIPLFNFSRCERPRINTNKVIKAKRDYSYEISLPYYVLEESIDILALSILEGMIQEFSYIYDKKCFSNDYSYYNKRFAEIAQCFGLLVEYTDAQHGYAIKTNKSFKKLCDESGFKKTWGKVYEHNKDLKNSSTVKYRDPDTGKSIRATSKHFIICFDECPEIGEQVEKMFGKHRMVIEQD